MFSLTLQASINIVGNDTIYYTDERYFMIYQADTFYIDTSLIFIKYNAIANAIDIESIEIEYDLHLNHYFTFGWHSYACDPGYGFVELATDLNGENMVEAVEYNTSVILLVNRWRPQMTILINSGIYRRLMWEMPGI